VCVCARACVRVCVCVCVFGLFVVGHHLTVRRTFWGFIFPRCEQSLRRARSFGSFVFPSVCDEDFFLPSLWSVISLCDEVCVCVCVCVVCRILPYHLYHRTWRLLQCVAVVRCSVLQRVAAWCSVLSWDHTLSIGSLSRKHSIWSKCSLMFMHCNTLQRTAEHRLLFQKAMLFVVCALQHSVTHCNTLQHTATHSNALQHTATHCSCFRKHTLLSS